MTHSYLKVNCDGPCPYEPLTYPSGSLSDGTTYTFTATPGATVIDLGSGTIEFGSNDPTLTVTFSAPVDFAFTNAVAPSIRTVWHSSGARSTRAETTGSGWCYNAGSSPLDLDVDGQVVTPSAGETGIDANGDWGSLESFATEEVNIRSYVWDAFNFEARPREPKCKQSVCDITDDLQNRVKVLESVPAPMLSVTTEDLFEYRDIWAEESGGANANTGEVSFGNGATGFIGLPIDEDWEVIGIGFHADVFSATATIEVALHDFAVNPTGAVGNDIVSVSLANSTDGGGQTNNAWKYEILAAPVPVPADSVLGFMTRAVTGTISDFRAYARLRRKVGSYVSGVTLI